MTFGYNSFAQDYKAKSKDSVVSIFINSKEVTEVAFASCQIPDTGFLIILDVNNLLADSKIEYWFGHETKVISHG